MSLSLLDAALAYAARGWPVFALSPRSKIPKKGSKGVLEATLDEQQIRRWWAAEPESNIGLHCGPAAGLFVLDVDVKAPAPKPNDKVSPITGPAALAELEAAYGPLPKTLEARTGGGGRHLVFRYPVGRTIKNRGGLKGLNGERTGLDIRSGGGYIVVAPSIHGSGGRYEWLDEDQAIVEAPAWLVDALSPAEQRGQQVLANTDGVHPYAVGSLNGACKRIREAGEGNRHEIIADESYMVGGFLHGGLNREDAAAALIQAGLDCGKGEREVRNAVHSGLDKGALAPRPLPERTDRPERSAPGPRDPSPRGHGDGSDGAGGETSAPAPKADIVAKLSALITDLELCQDPTQRGQLVEAIFAPELIEEMARLRRTQPAAGVAEFARLKAIRGVGADAGRLIKAIDATTKAFERADRENAAARRASAPRALGVALGDLKEGLDEGLSRLHVPQGYELSAEGVNRVQLTKKGDEEVTRICAAPLLIAARVQDSAGGGTFLDLRWHDGHAWRRRVVPQGVALNGRSLAELAQHELPVHGGNAADVARWLHDLLHENKLRLPLTTSTTQLGWHGEVFLWGFQSLQQGSSERSPVEFNRDDPGAAQLAAGYVSKGTFEGWCEAVKPLDKFPKLYLAIAAGIAPVLLRFFPEVDNFGVEWTGQTSQGKTSAMRVAASVAGLPHDRDEGLIRSWDASLTGVERAAAVGNFLPFLLDDTRRVQDITMVQRVIFAVAQGQGRLRGTLTGTAKQSTWRTILLSTGEDRLEDLVPATGGAAARMISLTGSPFGGESKENAAMARTLKTELLANHGHLLPRVVAWLQVPGNVLELHKLYKDSLALCIAEANGNAVAERMSAYVALLDCAIGVAGRVGMPAPQANPIISAWRGVLNSKGTADNKTQALHRVYEWACSREESFWGRHCRDTRDDTPRVPSNGWMGAWTREENWRIIGFIPAILKEWMTKNGMAAETILRQWAEAGWLQAANGGITRPTYFGAGSLKAQTRMVPIRREALEEIGALEAPKKLPMKVADDPNEDRPFG